MELSAESMARIAWCGIIPPRRNRKEPVAYDRHLYRERNVAERFFARVKQYRRVATRYDKKAANYLGFIWLASIQVMLT